MMKKAFVSLALAGMLAPGFVSADSISYNYVDGGFAYYPSFGNQDFFGIDATGSLAVTKDVFIFGGLKYLTDDVDLTAFHVGGAYRVEVAPDVDVYGGLTLEYQEVETRVVFFNPITSQIEQRTDSRSDTSLGLRGGVRARVNEQLEIGGQVRLVTGDWDYFGVSGYGQYFLSPNLGLVGELDSYDGELGVIGRIRYNF
jgi:hypothetical protein